MRAVILLKDSLIDTADVTDTNNAIQPVKLTLKATEGLTIEVTLDKRSSARLLKQMTELNKRYKFLPPPTPPTPIR